MISSVSFKNVPANNLYSAPQRFQRQTPYVADVPEKKKSGAGKKIAIGAAAVAAIAALLAVLASKGKLNPKAIAPDAGAITKAIESVKGGLNKAGLFIAENAGKLVEAAKGLFTKKAA